MAKDITNNQARELKIHPGMIIMIVLVGLMFFSVMWSLDGPDKIIKTISSANPLWLALAVLAFISAWYVEAMVLHHLIVGLLKPTQTKAESINLAIIGKLFDNITPMATGGQPIQIWRMSHRGMSTGGAVSVLLLKFIVFQVVVTIYSLIAFWLGFDFFSRASAGFGAMVLVGLLLNTLVMVALLAIVFASNWIKKVTLKLIHFLAKIHLLKNRQVAEEKVSLELEAFYASSRLVAKNKAILWQVAGLTTLQLALFHLIAWIVFAALGGQLSAFGWAFLASIFVWVATAFIPLPGASIGAEAAFYLFFAAIYRDGLAIGLAMMIWRLITFYLPIVIGMAVYMHDQRKKFKQVF